MTELVFVFGSNLAGRHGMGAALAARQKFGAVYGQGIGRQGQSYGIPTKGHFLRTLPLDVIEKHVNDFLAHARDNPEVTFHVTPIGCGLAGYCPEDIAPMFRGAPKNCELPLEFRAVLAQEGFGNRVGRGAK